MGKQVFVCFSLCPEYIRVLKAVKAHNGHYLNEVIAAALLDAKRIG